MKYYNNIIVFKGVILKFSSNKLLEIEIIVAI